MKSRISMSFALMAMLATAGQAQAWQTRGQTGGGVAVVAITAQEQDDVSYMREEEKLAHDIYLDYKAMWGGVVFDNIATSEARHFDAIGRLLTRYGVPDPAQPYPGNFLNGDLQAMYADLIDRGSASLSDALTAGGWVEEVDIGDLANAMAATTKPDLLKTYANLQCGSRNHLRTFALNLTALGVAYEAQVLPQEQVDQILALPVEACGRF